MNSPIIQVKNVTFGYEGRYVLEDASVSINHGDFMAIIGPNGSGKSTLMKICTGLIKPNSGCVSLFGTDISKFKNWEKIGYVPQKATSFNQDFPATVEEVVKVNLYCRVGLMRRISRKHMERVHEALDLVGMLDYKDRLVGRLSGGQQQRVFIAKALVSKPEILFLDEPTTGIDANSEKDFYGLMTDLNKDQNLTIVMVTHDIGAINKNVNRMVCLSGRKVHEHECGEGFDEQELSKLYSYDVAPIIHNH